MTIDGQYTRFDLRHKPVPWDGFDGDRAAPDTAENL
jgi:hypothetical protein